MEKTIRKTSALGWTESVVSTATTCMDSTTVTIDDLIAAKKLMDEIITESYEEIAEWMKKEGFDPEKGGILFIPKDTAKTLGCLPDFIKESPLLIKPALINSKYLLGTTYENKRRK